MNKDTLETIVAPYLENRDLPGLKAALMSFFQIPGISPDLDAWLMGEEPADGKYLLMPFEKVTDYTTTFDELLGLWEQPFPALVVGGNGEGVEFWLVLETGCVITLHHDATFFEEAGYIKAANPLEFMRRFEQVGSLFSFNQLNRLNAITATLDQSDDDLYGKELLKASAQILGKSLREMTEHFDDSSFSFVCTTMGYIYDYPEDLEEFLDTEEPM